MVITDLQGRDENHVVDYYTQRSTIITYALPVTFQTRVKTFLFSLITRLYDKKNILLKNKNNEQKKKILLEKME